MFNTEYPHNFPIYGAKKSFNKLEPRSTSYSLNHFLVTIFCKSKCQNLQSDRILFVEEFLKNNLPKGNEKLLFLNKILTNVAHHYVKTNGDKASFTNFWAYSDKYENDYTYCAFISVSWKIILSK